MNAFEVLTELTTITEYFDNEFNGSHPLALDKAYQIVNQCINLKYKNEIEKKDFNFLNIKDKYQEEEKND